MTQSQSDQSRKLGETGRQAHMPEGGQNCTGVGVASAVNESRWTHKCHCGAMRGLRWIGLASVLLVFFSGTIVIQLYRQANRGTPVLPVSRAPTLPVIRSTLTTRAALASATTTSAPVTKHLPLLQHPDPLIAYLRSNARDLVESTATPSPPVPAWVHSTNRLSLALAESLKSTNEHTPHYDGPAFTLAPDRVIIVIMTYARPGYVQRLLESLAAVDDIEETTLIVSTDGYHADIAQVVERVRFVQTKQIFFPASPHLFPAMHPGSDPRDCPRDLLLDQQRIRGCLGEPDRYNHFREPKFVSLKLHWFWLWNWLYRVYLPDDFGGNVLVLEDDAVITSRSFYRNAKRAFALRPTVCPLCRGVSMFRAGSSERSTELLVVSGANKAYGYTRQAVLDMVQHAEQFCTYDDYNWDVSADWLPTRTYGMLTMGISQLAVMGKCGLHGSDWEPGSKCNDDDTSVAQLVAEADHRLIDERTWRMPSLAMGDSVRHPTDRPPPRGGGGWSDKRDFALCRLIATMTRETISNPIEKKH